MFGVDDSALAEGILEVGGSGFLEVDLCLCSNASQGETEVTTRYLRASVIASSANAGRKIAPSLYTTS